MMSRILILISGVGVLVGCGEEPVGETASLAEVDVLTAEASLYADVMADNVDTAAPAGLGVLLTEEDGQVVLRDLRLSEPLVLTDGALNAAVTVDDVVLVSIDETLHVYDGTLSQSPLSDSLGEAPTRMQVDAAGALWLSAETVYRWQDDTLKRLRLDEQDVTGAIAPNGMRDGQPVTWMAHGAQAVAVDAALQPIDGADFSAIVSIAVDNTGAAWLDDGEQIWLRTPNDADWKAVQLPGSIEEMMGNPDGGLVWIRTSQGSFVGSVNGLAPVAVGDGSWLAVDDADRLLVQDGASVERLSTRRWAEWMAAPAVLTRPTTVALAVSTAADLDAAWALVNSEPVPFDVDARTITLDPANLPEGTVTVEAEVAWADGARIVTSLTLDVLPSDVTWEDDIEPITATNCAGCHTPENTVTLQTAEDWIAQFDLALEEIEAGTMPLGPDTLSNAEIALLNAWRDGGFQ
ncbi:MAG: hypothetical protein AAFV53_18820 [Myxococcota bacterium]